MELLRLSESLLNVRAEVGETVIAKRGNVVLGYESRGKAVASLPQPIRSCGEAGLALNTKVELKAALRRRY